MLISMTDYLRFVNSTEPNQEVHEDANEFLTMCLMYAFPGIALWFPDYLFGPYIP